MGFVASISFWVGLGAVVKLLAVWQVIVLVLGSDESFVGLQIRKKTDKNLLKTTGPLASVKSLSDLALASLQW